MSPNPTIHFFLVLLLVYVGSRASQILDFGSHPHRKTNTPQVHKLNEVRHYVSLKLGSVMWFRNIFCYTG